MQLMLIRLAFSVLITLVGKVPREQWEKLGPIITSFLTALSTKLAPGNPLTVKASNYNAPLGMLAPVDDDRNFTPAS